jgi:hypothetical protein
MILRGTYFGRPIGEQPADEAKHFSRCPGCGGWIDCRDSARCSSTRGRCHIRRRIGRNDETVLGETSGRPAKVRVKSVKRLLRKTREELAAAKELLKQDESRANRAKRKLASWTSHSA